MPKIARQRRCVPLTFPVDRRLSQVVIRSVVEKYGVRKTTNVRRRRAITTDDGMARRMTARRDARLSCLNLKHRRK